MIKNTKSFSEVADNPTGAEAVTAVKLAVDGAVIESAFLTKDFLRYKSALVTLKISV